jgi:hypothetical protein
LGFPHGQPRGGEQFEEAASAKKVKVFRVYMRLLAKSVTSLSGSGPTVFNPCKTVAIKLCGRFSASSTAEDMFVNNRKRRISAYGQSQPIRRYPLFGESEPGEDQSGGYYRDLRVSDKKVLAVLSPDGSGKSFKPH